MTGGISGVSGVMGPAPGVLACGAFTGVDAGFLQETRARAAAIGSDRDSDVFMDRGGECE